jgi:hypothetical protein
MQNARKKVAKKRFFRKNTPWPSPNQASFGFLSLSLSLLSPKAGEGWGRGWVVAGLERGELWAGSVLRAGLGAGLGRVDFELGRACGCFWEPLGTIGSL